MSWGPCWMYYRCPDCGQRFKSETGAIAALGDRFGRCPRCGQEGILIGEGPASPDDADYEEIDD
ncbi:MAG: excinuclease ATPase subunit [Oscillospiraceae bacterium]|nr:excinuclease ATPase subunit [Oscillospiraceae bacterium]